MRPGDTEYVSCPLAPSLARTHGYQHHQRPGEPTFLPVRPAIHHHKKCFSPPRVAAPLRGPSRPRVDGSSGSSTMIVRSIHRSYRIGWGQNVVKRIPARPFPSVNSPFGAGAAYPRFLPSSFITSPVQSLGPLCSLGSWQMARQFTLLFLVTRNRSRSLYFMECFLER